MIFRLLNVRRLCVVVNSLISAAKVCDCVISERCCDRLVELRFRQNILCQTLISFRRCLSLADCTLEKQLLTQENWI